MSENKKQEVTFVLPDSWVPVWDEEYEAWLGSMRVEGNGSRADFARSLIRLGLVEARRLR